MTMLMTASPTTPRADTCGAARNTSAVIALSIALDDARQRLHGALTDLRGLVTSGELERSESDALEAEYAEVYLARVAALEERGALACTPDEWRRYAARAQERNARRNSAKARRERLRDALVARQCLVLAPGRLVDPLLATLTAAEPDDEILEIRAELAASHLL